MPNVIVLPNEQAFASVAAGKPQQLVAYDPLTGESELILEEFVSGEADGALELMLPVPEPEEIHLDEPFHAIIVPRRLRGLEPRLALTPGARARAFTTSVLRPPAVAVAGGVAPRLVRPEITLTEFPVNVTATGPQALENAREVLDADELTMELQVLSFTGGSPSITVELQTGMNIESSSGWVSVASFASVSTAPSAQTRPFTNLLRYVRWNVSALAASSATFLVSGVARRWSKRT
jgi:hypothetical protein